MDRITGKEGKGVKGTGFDRAGASSSISTLPKSSNASLGIDAETAAGSSTARSLLKTSKEMNSGASVKKSSNAGLGIDSSSVPEGTVGSRENMQAAGPKANRGNFAVAAKSGGHNEGSTGSTLGSGSRSKGTGSDRGSRPGQTGSMALAMAGLSGGSGDGYTPNKSVTTKSLQLAAKGIKRQGRGNQ